MTLHLCPYPALHSPGGPWERRPGPCDVSCAGEVEAGSVIEIQEPLPDPFLESCLQGPDLAKNLSGVNSHFLVWT